MATRRTQFEVGGMACSFCADSIETAYARTDGVERADVNLAHEEVLVEYDEDRVSELEVRDTLRDLGYAIRDPDQTRRFEQQEAELRTARRRLGLSGAASLAVGAAMVWMVAAMGTLGSPSPVFDWGALALAVGVVLGPGRYILSKAYASLRRGILNQHVLLEAGAFAGLAGGLLGLAGVEGFPALHFFGVTVFVTTYHVLSEYASLVVRTRASRAVRDLLALRPDTARRVGEDGEAKEVPVDELDEGDRIRVKPGESVPADGRVVEGTSAVDESVATGESVPVDASPGDEVVGGSVVETGTLLVEVTATGEDAFLNRVARQVEEARAMKPGIVRLADRVLSYFVPAVLAVALGAFLFWTLAPPLWGGSPDPARGGFAALSTLVLGYPCALGMATPLALVRGGGRAAERGILLRGADAFQVLPRVDTVVLDKTGTITRGEPTVEAVVPLDGETEESVLRWAAGAEAFSDHPLATAVTRAAEDRGIDAPSPDAETFESVAGMGVAATVEGDPVRVGRPSWLASGGLDLGTGGTGEDGGAGAGSGDGRNGDAGTDGGDGEDEPAGPAVGDRIRALRERALTVVAVAVGDDPVGLVGIGDAPKDDAARAVEDLREAGVEPVMLTGDDERTARAVADRVGIDRVVAGVLPGEKREEVRRLQADGRVAMVGDGINDAPALTAADVGVAVGAGTDVAVESADVVLVDDRPSGVVEAREIARESYRTTRQNLVAAFAFNGVGVAAATTGLVHPVFAMVAMVLSVSAVLANSFGGRLVRGEGVNASFETGGGRSRHG